MMLDSENIKDILNSTLEPIKIPPLSFESNKLQSSALLSSVTGSILSFAMSDDMDHDANSLDVHSVNNLKVMGLLIKDKWSDDEKSPSEQTTKSCYNYDIPIELLKQKPTNNATENNNETLNTRIYIYELEELRACIAQLPKSNILLLFITSRDYPYGLLVKKMKYSLLSFQSLYNYKLE